MPDGSTVHLNSDSEIKVTFDDDCCQVDLIRGQALFQVAKDARRPFWVRAGDAVVKTVGTEFDAYRPLQGTVLWVVEDRVAVWRLPDGSYGHASVMELGADASRHAPIAQRDAGHQPRISRGSTVVSKHANDVRKPPSVAAAPSDLRSRSARSRDQGVQPLRRAPHSHRRSGVRAAEISGTFSAYDAESFVRFLERQPKCGCSMSATRSSSLPRCDANEVSVPVCSRTPS